ncbi:MAG: hypothetical protein P4M13_11115 [Alphaproteobacteria bacterium]|nr:hypothetical protein [Alphaproteobacteria bacterium]
MPEEKKLEPNPVEQELDEFGDPFVPLMYNRIPYSETIRSPKDPRLNVLIGGTWADPILVDLYRFYGQIANIPLYKHRCEPTCTILKTLLPNRFEERTIIPLTRRVGSHEEPIKLPVKDFLAAVQFFATNRKSKKDVLDLTDQNLPIAKGIVSQIPARGKDAWFIKFAMFKLTHANNVVSPTG